MAAEKPPKSTNSSYQNLLEGKTELVISTKDEVYSCNVSELLRDLYQKYYNAEKQLAQLNNANSANQTNQTNQAAAPGGPPVA